MDRFFPKHLSDREEKLIFASEKEKKRYFLQEKR